MLHLSSSSASSSHLASCLGLLARPPWQPLRLTHFQRKRALLTLRVSRVSLAMPPFWGDYSSTHSKIFLGGGRWLICILLKRELYIKGSSALAFNSCWPLTTRIAVQRLARREKRDILCFLFFCVCVLLLSLFVYFLDMLPLNCTETCVQTTCGCVCAHASNRARAPQRAEEREKGGGGRSICVFFCDIPLKSL